MTAEDWTLPHVLLFSLSNSLAPLLDTAAKKSGGINTREQKGEESSEDMARRGSDRRAWRSHTMALAGALRWE